MRRILHAIRRSLARCVHAGLRQRAALEMACVRATSWIPVHAARIAPLRLLGARIDRTAVIYHGCQVRAPHKLVIGFHSSIGDGSILDARGGLRFGNHVNVSSRAQFWTAQHDWKSAEFEYIEAAIEIGDRAWIGPNSIVLPGTTLGEGCVIAAGAVVRGEVPPFALMGGVPARQIGSRPHPMTYCLPGRRSKTKWW